MSSAAEIEQKGVTIINKIEHFGSEAESRFMQYCVSKFEFPLFPESKFVLDYSLNNDLSRDFYVYLSRYAGGSEKTLELNGTFSVVTSDGVIHLLGIFFDHAVEINTVKEFKLKKLDSIISYGTEELLPNDVLTLRCHIWSSTEEERESLKICFLSRLKVNKYSFKLEIPGSVEEEGIQNPLAYSTTIPWSSKTKAKSESVKLDLIFENFNSPEQVCSLRSYSICSGGIYLSSEITIECSNGSLVPFLRNYAVLDLRTKYKFCLCVDISELKRKKEFVCPNGNWNLICGFKFVTYDSINIESVNQGPCGVLNSNQDCSAVKIETKQAPEKEDETLSDSLYSSYEEEKFCDVTLRVKHFLYPSHRAVLGSRSEFFRTKFENSLKEKEKDIIDLEDDPQTLKMCLKFLYTDTLHVSELDDVLKLFAMSDKYIIPSLRKKCITLLKTNMTVRNACETLIMADMHNATDLKKALQIFICRHAKEVINSDDWKILRDRFPLLALETMDKVFNKVL